MINKYKKYFISISLILLFIVIIISIISINVYRNIKNNNKVVNHIKSIITIKDSLDKPIITNYNFNNTDYIGIINIDNTELPIKSKCSSLDSMCYYKNNKSNIILLSTTTKNGLYNYNDYEIDDIIYFIDNLGNKHNYTISNITRTKEVSRKDYSLIISIRDYKNMEYINLLCND